MKIYSIALIIVGMSLLFLAGWESSKRWYGHKNMYARLDTTAGMDLAPFFPNNIMTGGARGLDFGYGWHNDSLTVEFYLRDGYIFWTNYAGQTVRLKAWRMSEVVIDPPYDTTKMMVFSRGKISIDSSQPKHKK